MADDKPTYTGNDCDNCGRNRVEHSCWDKLGREICEKCWKVQGSEERVNPDAYQGECIFSTDIIKEGD